MFLTESYKLRLQELSGIKNYDKFPLSSLVKHAKYFDNFKDFEKSYSMDINHGYFWHITHNKDFKISNEIGPRDMSSMTSGGETVKGALMVTSHLENWDSLYNNYDKDDSEAEDIKRPYAALLDLSDVDPRKLKQVSRGFGNEIFIWPEDAKKIKIIKVYSIQDARKIDEELSDVIPQSEIELKKIWTYAQKTNKMENKKENIIRALVREQIAENLSDFGEEGFLPNLDPNGIDTTSLYKFLKDALGNLDIGNEDEQAEAAMKLEEVLLANYNISLKQF